MFDTETELSRAIRDALTGLDYVWCMRINAGGYRGRMVGAPKGTSDLVACVSVIENHGHYYAEHGLFVALEVKLPGCKTSPAQDAFARRIRALGGVYEVVTSVDEALRVVREVHDG